MRCQTCQMRTRVKTVIQPDKKKKARYFLSICLRCNEPIDIEKLDENDPPIDVKSL